ncbi:hypothetical protein BLNAU_2335 [Blattamonas nauphoetae]|uniref:Uncharacterized protein n=1 Tax=Blattamonas nauphoetae TaxID=2049346 RepID=A0ABQ9YFG1_9EUKA|nr:hypothetical protein BLNAU_2335 [Blattamonas nauphoetae]
MLQKQNRSKSILHQKDWKIVRKKKNVTKAMNSPKKRKLKLNLTPNPNQREILSNSTRRTEEQSETSEDAEMKEEKKKDEEKEQSENLWGEQAIPKWREGLPRWERESQTRRVSWTRRKRRQTTRIAWITSSFESIGFSFAWTRSR